jgi:hypothetical protein
VSGMQMVKGSSHSYNWLCFALFSVFSICMRASNIRC